MVIKSLQHYKENKEFYLNVENGKYKPVGSEGLNDLDKKFPTIYKKVSGSRNCRKIP